VSDGNGTGKAAASVGVARFYAEIHAI